MNIGTYSPDKFHLSSEALNYAEQLHRKHIKATSKMSARDSGRVHATIACMAYLKDVGHHKASEALESHLHWLTDYRQTSADKGKLR